MGKIIQVNLRNCKNIREASFEIEVGSLNIKYAPNGTGKSSIADGIVYAITKDENLGRRIVPFEDRGVPNAPDFLCQGLDAFNSAEVFNEGYVESVVFSENTLFNEGFEVFVKTAEYDATVKEIEAIFSEVHKAINQDQAKSLRYATNSVFEGISGNKGLTKGGELPGTAHAKRGLTVGNLKTNVPLSLDCFANYICTDRLEVWAKWRKTGNDLLSPSDTQCPFCGSDLDGRREMIAEADARYKANTVAHLDKFLGGIAVGEGFYSDDACKELRAIADSSCCPTEAQMRYLADVASQAAVISGAFDRGMQLGSFFRLASLGADIRPAIEECKVNLNLLSCFRSSMSEEAVASYNDRLDQLLEKVGILTGIVNRQKDKLAKSLEGYTEYINSFLSVAGYPYSIRIDASRDDQCSVVLVHESSFEVPNAQEALSYGERNALALVFFAHSMISKNPDLIILDDPITSFDGSKRFALLDMLFLRKRKPEQAQLPDPATLKGRTVVLLTHDFGVVFDVEHTLKSQFSPLAKTYHLHLSKGNLNEVLLQKSDMQPVRKLYAHLAAEASNVFIKLIYARRLLELTDEKDEAWDVLSSLFHHRTAPTRNDGKTLLDNSGVLKGIKRIEDLICASFDYDGSLRTLSDIHKMIDVFNLCDCNYEKLQIARISLNCETGEKVYDKILNESCHVENGYLWQLDPRRFEEVPDGLVERYQGLMVTKATGR